jgi:hypothetical protein
MIQADHQSLGVQRLRHNDPIGQLLACHEPL